MIVYSATKGQFNRDASSKQIANIVRSEFINKIHMPVTESEFNSWNNSLSRMNDVLSSTSLSDDVEVSIEFRIPLTAKRVDFMIAGLDENGKKSVVVVELKQWTRAERTSRDGIVTTVLNGAKRSVTHPSYQAYSYAKTIENYSKIAQDEDIGLLPCAYLHNYDCKYIDQLNDLRYQEIVKEAPFYIKDEEESLKDFIEKHIRKADQSKMLYRIDNGKIRPSKALQDALVSMMQGNEEFLMIDEQKVVFETVKKLVENAIKNGEKYTVIIEGGPGTGKSVIAINLLVALKGYLVNYVTKNAAPRNVYFEKLKTTFKYNYVKNIFKGSGGFIDVQTNTYDCLIVDEAHRLNEKSGIYKNNGENQIKEIINASKVSVFFIDEDQAVTADDIGSVVEIEFWAKKLGSTIYKNEDTKLVSQFRCNGSDGYISFIDNLLGLRQTANYDLEGLDYDVRLYESPSVMRMDLLSKNLVNNKARMIAGYCYEWVTKDRPNGSIYDIELEDGFRAKWNFNNTNFAIDPDSFDQVGCIHTTQGLEFDYCGIIIGKDLRYENGIVITDASKRAKSDKSLKGIKNNKRGLTADRIIRNTYKTLLTRGQKGCFIYCEDKGLRDYLKQFIKYYKEPLEMTDERGDMPF